MSLAMYRRIVYTYCNELEKKSWWYFHSVEFALNEKLNFTLTFQFGLQRERMEVCILF
ncbi:hypothetical protein ACRRTK_005356 [Alexandromys fortis]